MADLVSLTAPNGSSVKVAKEHVDVLLAAGYVKAGGAKASTKSASSKSEK